MTGPTKLSFDQKATVDPTPKDDWTPSPLSFDEQVDAYKRRANEDKAKQEVAARKLEFARVMVPPPPPKPQPPAPVFKSDDPFATILTQVTGHVKNNFVSLVGHLPSIERQARQLLPLKADIIITWGSVALEQEAQLATSIAALIRNISEVRGNEIIQQMTNALAPPPNSGLLGRMFGPKPADPRTLKPSVVVVREQLKLLRPSVEQYITDTVKAETRLMIHLAALIAVREVVGQSTDDAIEHAIMDRRTILQQGALQAKLARGQLVDTKRNITEMMLRVDQVLNVTLPAFELAHTHNNS